MSRSFFLLQVPLEELEKVLLKCFWQRVIMFADCSDHPLI
ncbi:hypothetical protein PAAL109150_00125 [Paenibacillus alkaliterrae]